jgi:hypothetical protein
MPYVAIFHSHPHNCPYVSSRDKATADRCQNSALYGSITPEGIISFFGFQNYQIMGDLRKIGDNQYQLELNSKLQSSSEKRGRRLTFLPYNGPATGRRRLQFRESTPWELLKYKLKEFFG